MLDLARKAFRKPYGSRVSIRLALVSTITFYISGPNARALYTPAIGAPYSSHWELEVYLDPEHRKKRGSLS